MVYNDENPVHAETKMCGNSPPLEISFVRDSRAG